MKRIFCSLIVLFPVISFAQLISSEINIIKLTDGTGYVLDSIENEQCKCITYVNKKEFQYAVLVQFPDSHLVLKIKRLNHSDFSDVQMTEAKVASLYTSALNLNKSFSITDSSTEMLLLNEVSGDSITCHFLNYDELKFPANIQNQNTLINKRMYRQLKIGFGIGGGVSFSNENDGLIFTIEPATHIKDDWAIGFRIETLVSLPFGKAFEEFNSFSINVQNYFGAGKFRPLAGIGLGLYDGDRTEAKFGFYPRVGFDLGHFSLSIDCNLIANPNTNLNSYLGFRIGFFLGGGRK